MSLMTNKRKISAFLNYILPYMESISLSFSASVSKQSKLMELGILQLQFPTCTAINKEKVAIRSAKIRLCLDMLHLKCTNHFLFFIWSLSPHNKDNNLIALRKRIKIMNLKTVAAQRIMVFVSQYMQLHPKIDTSKGRKINFGSK